MAINLFQELKRRKVVRVMVVYAVVGYAVIEVADTVLSTLGIPDWGATFVTVLVLLGFPLALVLSWMLDVTPEGIERTRPTAPDAPPAVTAVRGYPFNRRHRILGWWSTPEPASIIRGR